MLDNRHNLRFTSPARAKSRAGFDSLNKAAKSRKRNVWRLFSCLAVPYGRVGRESRKALPVPCRSVNPFGPSTCLTAGVRTSTRTKAQTMTTPEATPRPRFRRALTADQIDQIERDYNSTHGVNRRITQVVLAKSSGELLKLVWKMAKDDAGIETLTAMLDSMRAYEEHLEAGLELTRAAQDRVLGCGQYLAEQTEAAA